MKQIYVWLLGGGGLVVFNVFRMLGAAVPPCGNQSCLRPAIRGSKFCRQHEGSTR